MSATSSPGSAPDNLELAALLCSRVCHDLISPVGAIVNGLEVLDDNPKPEIGEFALDLIRKSARPRRRDCSSAVWRSGLRDRRARRSTWATRRPWRGVISRTARPRSRGICRGYCCLKQGQLLLNMMVIAQQTIPRGGVLTVDPVGEGDGIGFRVAAAGLNARMPQNIADLLSSGSTQAVDAHAVQPYYTRLLAQACGLKVVLAPEGDAVVVTASELGAREYG